MDTEVKVKKEYQTLDKTNFEQVHDFVLRIINDIWTTSKEEKSPKWQDELKKAMIVDYMIDLINPDLLDFDNPDLLNFDEPDLLDFDEPHQAN